MKYLIKKIRAFLALGMIIVSLAAGGMVPAFAAYEKTAYGVSAENGGGFVKLKKKKKKNKKNKNSTTSTPESAVKESENSADKSADKSDKASEKAGDELTVDEDGEYTSRDEVALYIHTYGKLPKNYISKRDAEELGWVARDGNLWDVAPGKSIGGSRFGNYEGLLPDKSGRKYYECDIDFDGTYRNAKRIIYSNDGLIFYTEDHYKTFEQLY